MLFFSTHLSFISTLWRSRWIELRLRLPCGFLPSAKILSPTSQIEKKRQVFQLTSHLSQPSGEVDGLNYANACPAGFCLRQKFFPRLRSEKMKKARTFVRAFLSQPSGEVDELNYACACPAGFCLRQKFFPRLRR